MSGLKPTPNNPIDASHLQRLRSAAGSGPVLIITHDTPDPDALASGKALGTLLETAWNIPCALRYTGVVARAENRAMLEKLTPEWRPIENLNNLEGYSALALVDTQPGAGNNALPSHVDPQIVIDHHLPVQPGTEQALYVDVRPDAGATVSLIYQYLEFARIIPEPTLATAMFYGLQTDTRGLARGASPIDEIVYVNLLNLIDRQKLIKVELAGLSRDYFRAFQLGLKAARVYQHCVFSFLGITSQPDLPAEMADLLIRLENIQAALCIALHHNILQLSLRTDPSAGDAGLLLQHIVAGLGKAGGHGMVAGGQVPLQGQKPDELVFLLQNKFLEIMQDHGQGEPLV